MALAVALGAGLPASRAAAQTSATGAQGQTLSVSVTTDLDPDGAVLTVDGAGYDEAKGIYVSFCVIPPPGQRPTPCAGGIDLTGSGGSTVWISSDPPSYATGLTTPYGPDGSFQVQLTVRAELDEFDCHVISCGVVTRADHTRSEDRTQDVFVPVAFAGDPIGTPTGSAQPAPTPGWAGCGPSTAVVDRDAIDPLVPGATPVLPVTVTSADGREVTVTDASRILPVNLYGSIAEIVFSLGLGDRVVGRDTSTTFAAAADLPLVTVNGHDLSAEGILQLDPTVVLADESIGPPEVFEQLRSAGIPVVMIDAGQTLDGVETHIGQIAAALGVVEAGERLIERTRQEIAVARASVVAPTDPLRIAFLYLRGSAGISLMTGEGAGPDAMIEAIGAIDTGTELGIEGFKPITSEALITAAPDVILVLTDSLASVGGVQGLLGVPGIAQTPAGEEGRIVDMDDGVLLNFGTRTGAAISALARAVYQPCD
ncbi:MAG: ABC transporter substrate-binding protein [Chloroflexi bacterium]|nr:ABC transporter substrate-binding protein [Chloroflexota bacterium]